MKNFYFTLLFLPALVFGQISSNLKIDTTVSVGGYKSFINYQIRQPLQVSYIAYKGGGNCDRVSFRFKNHSGIDLINASNYGNSGYDIGHLAPAELFAFDCQLDSLTFWFGNAIPQHPSLNRGIWLEWERYAVNLSQIDSLLVSCGGVYDKKSKSINGMLVSTYCWKSIYSLKQQRYTKILLFTNKKNPTITEITLEKLESILGRKLSVNVFK